MGNLNQQYCLRWNNHRSNLLLVFEHLFHTEAFTDVTLACDGHSIKCHKMVLAACSSYFQHLFLENDCRHPIVILKDILFSDVKAILEYMYKGEVNVGQDQLSGLLKAAETLKVKGLVEDHNRRTSSPHSSTLYSQQSQQQQQQQLHLQQQPQQQQQQCNSGNGSSSGGGNSSNSRCTTTSTIQLSHPTIQTSHQHSIEYDVSSNVSSSYHKLNPLSSCSKFMNIDSGNGGGNNGGGVGSGYGSNSSGCGGHYDKNDLSSLPFHHVWTTTKTSPHHHSTKSGHCSATFENPMDSSSGSSTSYKRKNNYYRTCSTIKDSPILRTVLGHTTLAGGSGSGSGGSGSSSSHGPSSSDLKSLSFSLSASSISNGPNDINDKGIRESPEAYYDDSNRSVESDKMPEDNQPFVGLETDESKLLVTHFTTTSSNQKPEWKRYKQYTRNDIMAAIDAVRSGMSALQAARKYGVPSRTLYDKVKKMGITTNRPYRKGSFPMSPYHGLNLKMDENTSGYSPEEPLDISAIGHGHEGDSDKMDSDAGSTSIKQEQSPRLDDPEQSPIHYERGGDENNPDNDSSDKASPMTSLPIGFLLRRDPASYFTITSLNGSYYGPYKNN